MKVGVFDSGIGGLTVLERLIKNYPNNEYVYFGDTLNLPYGNKSLDELRSYADKIINFLINAKVDIIVIACGTISSNLYNEIKEKYSIPIIDVLTPTFKFIIDNNLEGVGVFATQMTINSGAFDKVSNRTIACPLFVPLIEKGKINANVGVLSMKSESIISGTNHKITLVREKSRMLKIYIDNSLDCSGFNDRAKENISTELTSSAENFKVVNTATPYNQINTLADILKRKKKQIRKEAGK